MGYNKQLKKASEWLISIQNDNDGWGLTPGQASSLVNTAEAVYILTKCHSSEYNERVLRGKEFLKRNGLKSVDKEPRVRYIIFTLIGLMENYDSADNLYIEHCVDWLLNARSANGAWGHIAKSDETYLFPTCLALNVLYNLGYAKEITTAYNWVLSLKRQRGWGFLENREESVTATSMAIATLTNIKQATDDVFIRPKELLLQNSMWSIETEDIPGTPWIHGSYMWIIPALLKLGLRSYDKIIASGVREINKLNCNNGWREPTHSLTVRGQYWAVVTFEEILNSFDPAIDTYQIDTAITAKSEIDEVKDVVINLHKKSRVIVPKFWYQFFTYALFLITIILFTGVHRQLSFPERRLDAILSTIIFAVIYLLVRKRNHVFPKFSKVITIIGIGLSLLDLVTGISIFDLYEFVSNLW